MRAADGAAKSSDSRSKNWKGETCQLEALPPDETGILFRGRLKSVLDMEALEGTRAEGQEERKELMQMFLPSPGRG